MDTKEVINFKNQDCSLTIAENFQLKIVGNFQLKNFSEKKVGNLINSFSKIRELVEKNEIKVINFRLYSTDFEAIDFFKSHLLKFASGKNVEIRWHSLYSEVLDFWINIEELLSPKNPFLHIIGKISEDTAEINATLKNENLNIAGKLTSAEVPLFRLIKKIIKGSSKKEKIKRISFTLSEIEGCHIGIISEMISGFPKAPKIIWHDSNNAQMIEMGAKLQDVLGVNFEMKE